MVIGRPRRQRLGTRHGDHLPDRLFPDRPAIKCREWTASESNDDSSKGRPPPDGVSEAAPRYRQYCSTVTDDVLTMEGLRLRRTEILGIARKRRAHRIA